MKFKNLIIGTVACTTIIGFTGAYADATTSQYNNTSVSEKSISKSLPTQNDLKNSHYTVQKNNDGSTSYNITDQEYVELLRENGQNEVANKLEQEIQKENNGINMYKAKNGVNSVSVTGKGAVVIKVNKTVAKALAATGGGAAGAAAGLLVNAIPGLGQIAAPVVSGAAAGLIGFLAQNSVKGGAWIKVGLVSKKTLAVGWQ